MDKSIKFKQKKCLLILAFANLCFWISMMAIYPITPILSSELNTSPSNLGKILGLSSLIMLILNIPAGILSDKFGRVPYIKLGMTLIFLSSILTFFSKNYILFSIFWLLGGIGRGLFLSPAFAIIGDVYSIKERGTAMGILTASIGIGTIIGYILGSILGGIIGWRIVFIIVSILNFLAIIASFFIIETSPKKSQKTVIEIVQSLFGLFKIKTTRLLSIISLLGFSSSVAITFILPFIFERKNLSLTYLTWFFLSYEIFATISTIFIGKISDKYGRKRPLLWICLISSGSLIGLLLSNEYIYAILIFYTILSCSETPLISITGTMITDIINKIDPQEIGSALGSFRTIYSLGAVIGPWLGGLLVETSSLSNCFIIVLLISLICLALSSFVKETFNN